MNYFLDDPTFEEDHLAVSDRASENFTDWIYSYGNVEIEIRVLAGPKWYKQRAWLSDMLEAGYANDQTPAIRYAIERIKTH